MNKYLNGDPVPWLTDGENPAVTYLAKRDLLSDGDPGRLYSQLELSALTGYFRKNSSGNILGDSKNFDTFYRGSVWFFLLAVESGYDCRTDFVSKTADFLCGRSQLPDGGFSLRLNPPVSTGCRTGNIVTAMIKAGFNDERTESGISWIIKNQRPDGGWLHCPFRSTADIIKFVFMNRRGKGGSDDSDPQVQSCPVATFSCMSALALAGKPDSVEALRNAARFMLGLNYTQKNKNLSTRCGLSTELLKTGYPVMSQFEIISLLRVISDAGSWNTRGTAEIFNHLIGLQGSNGRWSSSNSCQGMIKEKFRESRWVTLNALRLIKAVSGSEFQLEKA